MIQGFCKICHPLLGSAAALVLAMAAQAQDFGGSFDGGSFGAGGDGGASGPATAPIPPAAADGGGGGGDDFGGSFGGGDSLPASPPPGGDGITGQPPDGVAMPPPRPAVEMAARAVATLAMAVRSIPTWQEALYRQSLLQSAPGRRKFNLRPWTTRSPPSNCAISVCHQLTNCDRASFTVPRPPHCPGGRW